MSRPGLRWIVRRLILCKHSHNDLGTRSPKVGKVINRYPDTSTLALLPSATGRGEALLISGLGMRRVRGRRMRPVFFVGHDVLWVAGAED